MYDPAHEHDACGLGFVAHLHGERSSRIVHTALQLLANMAHRGASAGATSDGAGILVQLPHAYLRAACHAEHLPLPEAGEYGVGMLFLPANEAGRARAAARIDAIVALHGCRVLGWRAVPVNPGVLAGAAYATLPSIQQILIATSTIEPVADDPSAFERTLYIIRRAIERASIADDLGVYVSSLSSRTVVYKGLLNPDQLSAFYHDLASPEFHTGIALVHSRFSTNTFPSWANAHPFRFLCHNGEINTLRGNVNWMRVREPELASPRFPHGIDELRPIVQSNQSDSACLDNAIELLVHAGRPLAHAMAMLVPEAWQSDASIPDDRRAFYAYHASLVEPWDGPAAIAFTDGRQVGAIQDRNGLRPARWVLTDDDLVILASEAGVIPIDASRVREKGRLQPGRVLLVNTTQGRLLHDDEVKAELSTLRPYRKWVADERIDLESHIASAEATREPSPPYASAEFKASLRRAHRTFGYARDEIATVLEPMMRTGEEATGSMGSDTPLAILSTQPQLLYSYFRQLFAQVTNPPIDPIREQLVMSLHTWLGAQRNLLDETPEHARQVEVARPVLSDAAFAALHSLGESHVRHATLPTRFAASDRRALATAVHALCDAAAAAVIAGANVLILSDRAECANNARAGDGSAPIPSLLATAAVHHHLLRHGLRARTSLVVATGDARDVSQIALLFSYGAAAVHPYLALETCGWLASQSVPVSDAAKAASKAKASYLKAVEKGLLKILSKMGISTLQSYCGAQNWEAVGIGRDVIDRYFTGTPSPLGGLGLEALADDVLRRHREACDDDAGDLLEDRGEYHFRVRGEHHGWNPTTIATLQRAAREGSWDSYEEFARVSDEEQRAPTTIRGMLDFAVTTPIPLDDVEPASAIVRRFVTGAMSFGSISREAHETLALAMNALGGRSNTGEGGEDPARFGTPTNSAIKQVASARFGVTAAYLVSASEIQIKISQGAKPGEGGQLPGHKVDETIGKTRHATPGVSLISPPPHHDIYSIEDLKQLIFDLRQVHPDAAISVKLVAEAGVGTVTAGVAKAGADLLTISGDGGGTGAAPLSSIKRAGVPWEMGLAEAQQTLRLNGLRGQVRLQADGQLKTGRDVVIAAMLGADEFGFATAPLVVQGCIMMRKCHLNTCPVGIATQDPQLREKFTGKPEHVINYFYFVAEETRRLLAQLGARTVGEIVGRSDLLRQRTDIAHTKARTLDPRAAIAQRSGR